MKGLGIRNMKKFKLVLLLCACVLGLTACGGQSEEKTLDVNEATDLESMTQSIITDVFTQFTPEQAEEFAGMGPEYMEVVFDSYFNMKVEGNAIVNGIRSWNSAAADMGALQNITGMDAVYDDQTGDIIVTINVAGSSRTAQVEAIYDDDLYHTLTSLTTNVDYTFGEKMGKAGLNTLMGMGTVFVVLILISLIISLFKFIPMIQDKLANKNKPAEVKPEADPAIMQIVETEEQTDNLELIAVITAAIAAYGDSTSADDFVVRSIRRRANSKWNKSN